MNDYPEAVRAAYPVLHRIPTRWNDNDVYGHMNNVVYYEYVDTVVNRWLIESGALDIPGGPVVGLVAESQCRFMASLGFPDMLEIGLCALRVGRTSVTYGIALFREGVAEPAALCRYVHVYVDAASRRPTPLPDSFREALEGLKSPSMA
ncbi:MAG: acyl-CoA thioesterase [Pikeienuella sp.]